MQHGQYTRRTQTLHEASARHGHSWPLQLTTLISMNFLYVSEVGVESLSDAAATVIQQTFHATQSGESQDVPGQCCSNALQPDASADIALACPPVRQQGSPKENVA